MIQDFLSQSWITLDDGAGVELKTHTRLDQPCTDIDFDDIMTLEDAMEEILIDDDKTREYLESLRLTLPAVNDLLNTLYPSSNSEASTLSDTPENTSDSNTLCSSSESFEEAMRDTITVAAAATLCSCWEYPGFLHWHWGPRDDHRSLPPWVPNQWYEPFKHFQEVYDVRFVEGNGMEFFPAGLFETHAPVTPPKGPLPLPPPTTKSSNALGLLLADMTALAHPQDEEDLPEVCGQNDSEDEHADTPLSYFPVTDRNEYESPAGTPPAWFLADVERIGRIHV